MIDATKATEVSNNSKIVPTGGRPPHPLEPGERFSREGRTHPRPLPHAAPTLARMWALCPRLGAHQGTGDWKVYATARAAR